LHLRLKITLVLGIGKHRVGDQQRNPGTMCRRVGEMRSLLRTDPAEHQHEAALGVMRRQRFDRHGVGNRRE
jgi:hypothetical protein